MTSTLRGVLHVHSTLSYDGQHELAELAAFAHGRGYDFVGMSEHSDTLDQARVSELADLCRRLSRADLLLIPGVEFTCDGNLHLLGFGIRQYTEEKRPAMLARHVVEAGGVPVVAHPSRYEYRLPEELATWLAGIEVWNAGYDGRFVPNPRSLQLLSALRRRNRALVAFCGQDVHRMRHFSGVDVVVECARLEEPAILDALRRGHFTIQGRLFRLDARGEVSRAAMLKLRLARQAYESAKRLRDRIEALRTVTRTTATRVRVQLDGTRWRQG